MDMQVRRVAATEADVLRRVRLAALQDAPAAFCSTYEREANFPADEWQARVSGSATGDERTTFFAEDDAAGGEVMGMVAGLHETPSSPTVELLSMWVSPQARGRGVGGLLVQAVVDWAQSVGATGVVLSVMRGNTAAQQLYVQHGFVATGEVVVHATDASLDQMHMALTWASARST